MRTMLRFLPTLLPDEFEALLASVPQDRNYGSVEIS